MLVILLTMMLLTSVVWSDDDKTTDEWTDFRIMMTERHKMVRSMMTMTRETMEIVKNMEHHPSAADKKKLDNMIKDVDTMIEQDVEIGKKMMKKWKKEDWGDKGHHGNM
jgi:hypothetical protein